MKILNIHATFGPNYWSVRRHRLIVMLLDLEALESQPTDQINGFYERMVSTFPGLYEHQCSEGVPGGFLKRVKRGTWMGHVIEHIALELQVLAGLNVGFGRARGAGTEGHYYVVFDYVDEESGRLTAVKAVEIAQKLVDGLTIDISSYINEIREINLRHRPGPSTSSILQEADKRNIPYIKLEECSTYQLGYACFQKKIAATIASTTSNIAVDLACNKVACRHLFEEMRIPVAEGKVVYSRKELKTVVEEMGFPLVVKPTSGNQGRGVTTNIQSLSAAGQAYKAGRRISDSVIVERHVQGNDFRLLIVNHKLVAAAKRTPAHVIGDGKSTIKELIDIVNSDPHRGEGHNNILTKIAIDRNTEEILKNRGYTLATVLPEKEWLDLDYVANLSKGGTAEDVTDMLHPDVVALGERISKVVDLDICGVDLIAPSLDKPLSSTGGAVLEVNAAPGFRMHLFPSKGKPRNVAAPVVDMLFPAETKSRIPIIAVTGTNGKTTTTRLISHIMETAGRRVGYTTTDGIYVNGQLIMKGDCGGPKSAELILKDPTVDTAVLECARGGILRSGLGFDQCDAAVVTNISSDHLGLKGINTLDKMSRVKSVVPESVIKSGYAVLNADDDRVFAMSEKLSCRTILFSMDSNNLRLLAHRKANGISIVYQKGAIVIWEGNVTHIIDKIENIPLGFGGRAEFMIENILAAVAAAYSQNMALNVIRKALRSFTPSPEQTPGRMNLFSFSNYDVIIDYAHNPAGITAVKNFLDVSSYRYKVGIVTAIGDRRREDNLEMGRIAAKIFDEIIIREDHDLRGKKPGELTEVIKQGIANSGNNPKVRAIADEKQALLFAMNHALPGSVIILCAEKIDDMVELVKQKQTRRITHRLPLPKLQHIKSNLLKNQ